MSRHLLLLLLLPIFTSALHAQLRSEDVSRAGGGTTYVIAFPDTTMNMADLRHPNTRYTDNAYIYIYSAVDNRVTIRGAGFNRTELLQAGKFRIVDLMDPTARSGQPIVTESNNVNQATFRLEADQPILLYCYLRTSFGAEAWTPIPIESWGTEYFVAARAGEVPVDITPGVEWGFTAKRKMAPAEITIVAAYDDTHISIVPNGMLLNSPRITNVTLQANEVYQVQSFVDTTLFFSGRQPDLGGSYVSATKPVGVISGNTRARVIEFEEGEAQNSFRNMLVEWLAPVEQHGTEFVYMPTWDDRRPTGIPVQDTAGRRQGEHVRIYGTSQGTTAGYSLDWNGQTDFTIAGRGKFREDFITLPAARSYRTDRPAQAFMNSTAVFKYSGAGFGSPGSTDRYDAWGAYMVEMIPRHQWTDFAPFYAPPAPAEMVHYINVAVDSAHRFDVYTETGSRFIFDHGPIAGTDLVWGTMNVIPGRDHWLQGRNGARFTGHVYGIYKGVEDSRVKGAKKGDGEILSAMPYEETLAIAYGYPLASRRAVAGTGDSLEITTTMICQRMTIEVRALNVNPAGLKTIRLDSAINTRFASITPQSITGATGATIVVTPINTAEDADAVVVITDRTGKVWRIRYHYRAERMIIDPASRLLDFEMVTPGSSRVLSVTIVNPIDRAITIIGAALLGRDQDFEIVSTSSTVPLVLAPGDSLSVAVRYSPTRENHTNIDSLRIRTTCLDLLVGITGRSSDPRIDVSDLDFGTIGIGVSKRMTMKVCNIGSGLLEFRKGSDSMFLYWLKEHTEFTVEPWEIDRIATARLVGPDTCMEIQVVFKSDVAGTFRDSAQLYTRSGSRDRKDYSIWTGVTEEIAGVAGTDDAMRPVTVSPNPASGVSTIAFRLERPGRVRLVVVDAEGREVTAIETMLPAGERSIPWDTSSLPAGIYFYRLVTDDLYPATGSIVVVR